MTPPTTDPSAMLLNWQSLGVTGVLIAIVFWLLKRLAEKEDVINEKDKVIVRCTENLATAVEIIKSHQALTEAAIKTEGAAIRAAMSHYVAHVSTFESQRTPPPYSPHFPDPTDPPPIGTE